MSSNIGNLLTIAPRAVPDKCGNIIDLTFTIHLSKTSFAFLPKQTQRFGLTKSNSFCNISVYVFNLFSAKVLDISLSCTKYLFASVKYIANLFLIRPLINKSAILPPLPLFLWVASCNPNGLDTIASWHSSYHFASRNGSCAISIIRTLST